VLIDEYSSSVPVKTQIAIVAMPTAICKIQCSEFILKRERFLPHAISALVLLLLFCPPVAAEAVRLVDAAECRRFQPLELPVRSLRLRLDAQVIEIKVEHATWNIERNQGLQCRAELPTGNGMLFSFARPTETVFWMFNTYIPLDILYLDRDLGIVGYSRMTPCPRPAGYGDMAWKRHCLRIASARYRSSSPYSHALELPAGWLAGQDWPMERINEIAIEWD
jgi:hypothetical protein